MRWLRTQLEAAQIAHNRVTHRTPIRSLLSQQRELGVDMTAQELRNMIAEQSHARDVIAGVAGMTATARLMHEFDALDNLCYIAVFSAVHGNASVGRRIQAKLPPREGTSDDACFVTLSETCVSNIMNSTYGFSAMDWLKGNFPVS
jgi:hypothetical protein